jgi:hypothetical protein
MRRCQMKLVFFSNIGPPDGNMLMFIYDYFVIKQLMLQTYSLLISLALTKLHCDQNQLPLEYKVTGKQAACRLTADTCYLQRTEL